MPWRLIGLVLILGIFLTFIGFNLDNHCDINFGFAALEDTPVYLTVFASFVLGLLCAVPFAVSFRRKKKAKTAKTPEAPGSAGKTKKSREKKESAENYENDGSYGID